MRQWFVKIAAAFLVLLVLLSLLDFGTGLVLDWRSLSTTNDKNNSSWQLQLPNYADKAWAQGYWSEHQKVKAQYVSYLGWIHVAQKGNAININQDGSRRVVNSNGSGLSTWFLGGSTMFGAGAPDELTIPSLLADQVEIAGVNWGCSGYTAMQSLQLLRKELGRRTIPDLVITYDGVNNSTVNRTSGAHRRELQFRVRIQGADNEEPLMHTFSPLKQLMGTASNPVPDWTTATIDDAATAKELLDTWLEMLSVCTSKNVELICVLQPAAYYGAPDLSNLSAVSANWDQHGAWEKGFGYYDQVKRLIQTERYQELVPHFLDLSTALDGGPACFIDFCHLDPEGNEIIAHAIKAELLYRNLFSE